MNLGMWPNSMLYAGAKNSLPLQSAAQQGKIPSAVVHSVPFPRGWS